MTLEIMKTCLQTGILTIDTFLFTNLIFSTIFKVSPYHENEGNWIEGQFKRQFEDRRISKA